MSKYNHKLSPEDKKLWVAALRSGDYKQTTGLLFRTPFGVNDHNNSKRESHCCIGVFAEVKGILTESYLAKSGSATGEACEALGLLGFSTSLADVSVQRKLIDMNDNEGMSFAEIADWIEANL